MDAFAAHREPLEAWLHPQGYAFHAQVALDGDAALVGQELDDGRPSLVTGAVQRRASGFGVDIRVDTQIQQHFHGFDVGLLRPLVGDAVNPADTRRHL